MSVRAYTEFRGLRDVSPPAYLTTSATPLIYVPPERRAYIEKVMVTSSDTVNNYVLLGQLSGTTFTPLLPPIQLPAGQTVTIPSDRLPSAFVYSSATQINAWAAATAAAPSSSTAISIVIEVVYA